MLLKIISRTDLAAAQAEGQILQESLRTEGFTHLSYAEQVLIPANERYHAQTDLVLLEILPQQLQHPLVVEDSYGSGTAFPHVYGPIPSEAIGRIFDFPPRPDGSFVLPDAVTEAVAEEAESDAGQ